MKISPKSVTIKCHQKILEQMNEIHKSILRINKKAIGLFCYIKYNKNKIPIIIVNDYISNKNYFSTKELINNKVKLIDIDEIIYKNEINNITIIKIKEIKNKNIKFFELDDGLYEKEPEIYYLNESIYTIQNNKNELSVSYGIIKAINKAEIVYSGNIDSNISLIFNLNTNKLIGINKDNSNYLNKGTIFTSILKKIKNYNNYKNEISILVKVQKEDVNQKINFLNDDFNNINRLNKFNSELYINNKRDEYKTYITSDKIGINKILLKFSIDLNNVENMFQNCDKIVSINFKEFNTNNIKKMKCMFDGCKKLRKIDSLNIDTHNVENMSSVFNCCHSLENLPDISKWDTQNVKDMSNIFNGCNLLLYLPDISKWDTHNVKSMISMFCDCSSLKNLPDISKFNTHNVEDMSNMFNGCSSLKYLPDISKWNTQNVRDMSNMFKDCISIQNLPDISKWVTSSLIDLSSMFYGCRSLKYLPNINNWDLDNIQDIRNIFDGCSSLTNLSDFAEMENKNIGNMSFCY